jgi:hypothetical protein
LNVVGFTITGATNAVLLVNTNGVVSAPIIETTANLVLPNWQVVSATTSYPVQTNGSYSYSFAVSAGAFYRAVQLSGTNTVTINGTLIANGSSLTSLDLNSSLTATVAKAAAALTNITASQIVAAGGVTNVSLNGTLLTVVDGVATGTVASAGGGGGGDIAAASNNVFYSATPITLTNANASIRWLGATFTNSYYLTSTSAVWTIGTNTYAFP